MTNKIVVLAACLAIVAGYVQAQPVGLEFYDNLSSLPYIYPNAESYYLSSYDRSGGNDDGFRGTYSQLYVDDKGNNNDTPANYSSLVYYYYIPN